MPLTIALESPLTPDGRALIDGSELALREVYKPSECFSFTAEELDKPQITFLVARDGRDAVGCVALVNCGTYAEVKRLFVVPEARGTGAARALMAELEQQASAMGLNCVLLETGEKLSAAVALYTALGYAPRGKFGEYPDHPASMFMGKPLA